MPIALLPWASSCAAIPVALRAAGVRIPVFASAARSNSGLSRLNRRLLGAAYLPAVSHQSRPVGIIRFWHGQTVATGCALRTINDGNGRNRAEQATELGVATTPLRLPRSNAHRFRVPLHVQNDMEVHSLCLGI